MVDVRKAFAYLWDFKARKIERLEAQARHPYAKKQDEVDKAKREELNKKLYPWRKK